MTPIISNLASPSWENRRVFDERRCNLRYVSVCRKKIEGLLEWEKYENIGGISIKYLNMSLRDIQRDCSDMIDPKSKSWRKEVNNLTRISNSFNAENLIYLRDYLAQRKKKVLNFTHIWRTGLASYNETLLKNYQIDVNNISHDEWKEISKYRDECNESKKVYT